MWAGVLLRLIKFVEKFYGRHKQRSKGWKAGRLIKVGASELGSVMGLNPYPNSSYENVLAEKAGASVDGRDPHTYGYLNWYCVFGTMMEEAITIVVEIDLGTPVVGDTINIPAPYAEHANSPDGFGVVWIAPPESPGPSPVLKELGVDEKKACRDEVTERSYEDASILVNAMAKTADPTRSTIWTTDRGAPPPGSVPTPVLFEFKSPPSRPVGVRHSAKKGPVPRHYIPQMWSGIDLSAEAGVDMAIFVDAGFRACSIEDVDFTSSYNRSLHRKKITRADQAYVDRGAWATGVIGLYGPEPLPPLADGSPAPLRDVGGRAQTWENPQLPVEFDYVCRLIDDKVLAFQAGKPAFVDGRGATLAEARTPPAEGPDPGHPHLIGYIGWKLFRVEYVQVPRRVGFVEEIRPKLQELIAEAEEIKKSGDTLEARTAEWLRRYHPDLLGEMAVAEDLFADVKIIDSPAKSPKLPPVAAAAMPMPPTVTPADELFAEMGIETPPG